MLAPDGLRAEVYFVTGTDSAVSMQDEQDPGILLNV